MDCGQRDLSLNVERDRSNPAGVFQRYHRLIALRRDHAVIQRGDFRLLLPAHPSLFAYERRLGDDRLLVIANLSGRVVELPPCEIPPVRKDDILTGSPVSTEAGACLDPYATFAVWL